MFGHKKGSFTGADRDRKGAFMEADGGTLFLDEIGDLEYGLQTKLLRAIQEKIIRPVGSDKDVQVDPRIICATNKDLRECCKTNQFREDLYYRLVTVVLVVPPLRDRKEDIIPLARHFVGLASKWSRTLTPEAEKRLLGYAWPGNVRELRSLMEQAVIFAVGNEIRVEELNFPRTDGDVDEDTLSLADVERRHIVRVLKTCKGNRTEAAKALGLARSTLVVKLKGYNIDTV
jgi:DNA-binding NtrC family response regulator